MIDASKRPTAREILNDPWLVDTQAPKVSRSISNQPPV